MMGHTRKQGELLAFISSYIAQHGIAPSSDEMRDAMGLASKSGVNRMLNGLEERGLIRRVHFRARAIEVVCDIQPKKTTTEIADEVCFKTQKLIDSGSKLTWEALHGFVIGALAA